MTVNKPGDKLEQEADKMAGKVMRMPSPASIEKKLPEQTNEKLQKKEKEKEEKIQRAPISEEKVSKKEEEKIQKAAASEEKLQRDGGGAPSLTSDTQTAIQGKTTGGQPLSSDVRGYMEPRFNADFSNVRIHSDAESAGLSNQLSARAFTYQNHVFFSRDQYQPGTSEGKQLLAHELTHTIQQGHSIQRSPQVSTTTAAPPIQRFLGIDIPSWQDVIDWLAEKAYNIPGYRMFTIVIGVNPINGEAADRSAANILRAIVEFLPGGKIITDALEKYNVFEKAGSWVEGKLKRFSNLLGTIKSAIGKFIDDLDFLDIILHPVRTWERAVSIFTKPVNEIIDFIGSIFQEILQFIRDAVLMPLAALAKNTRGFDLLCALLGKNPITKEPVPRTPDTLIGGFMKLIGQEEIWENIKKGNAVQKAWQWFQNAMQGLFALVARFPEDFIAMLKSLEVMDFIILPNLFAKVIKVFGNFILDFYKWALNTVLDLLEIIFTVVAPKAVPYVAKAKSTFITIIKNPVGFVGNLVRAGKMGFEMFKERIGEHLKAALINWLVGPLAEAGVYIPKSFTLIEIVKLVLSVLGLTWQNIRNKLVKIIPEPVLVVLEKTAGILVTLVKDGPAAAWEQIKAELTDLKDQLIAQITQMVTTEIVKAAVTKLVTMLNPAGAVIQAIIAIYNTISFFIQKINQIAAVVASFIDSISAIAAGQIANAAKKVEQTMANTLTVIIAFLAKFAGLGGIPDKIVGIVKKIRQPIDKGLDKIVDWLGKMLSKAKAAVSEWWKAKKPFTNKAGEAHTLSFSGSADNATLMIATTTIPITTYLEQKKTENKDNPEILAKIALAEGVIKQKEIVFKQGTKTKEEKESTQLVTAALAEISQTLMDLGGGDLTAKDYPEPVISPGGVPPTESKVEKQSSAKLKKGTPTSGNHGTQGWSYIEDQKLSSLKGDKWVQMHLVSNTLGGNAVAGNLIPAPNSVNSAWRSGIEGATSSLLAKKADSAKSPASVIWLTTRVSYFGEKVSGNQFANSVSTTAGLHLYKGKKAGVADFSEKGPSSFSMSAQVPLPDFTSSDKASLNTSGGTHLREKGGISASIVNDIKRNRPYSDINDFEGKMLISLKSRFPDTNSKEYRDNANVIKAVRFNKKVVVDK
ncbi:MAG: hypothetical protein HBSAPP01_00120 [Candidatus Brocadia sapporoensis]|nr:MAG: hypothetical protein HBSAPP01_00120 [Candidatus Brocadia sapporoensis]